MRIIPRETVGDLSGTRKPVFFRQRKKIFFLLSCQSILNLFSIKGLILKARTPILHPNEIINFTFAFKNRVVIFFPGTFFVLDHFVPTLKSFFKKETDVKIVQSYNFLLLFYKKESSIYILDPLKINLIKKISLSSDIVDIHVIKKDSDKNLLIGFSEKGSIELWNLSNLLKIKHFHLRLKVSIRAIHPLYQNNTVFLVLRNKTVLLFDYHSAQLSKNKKISFLYSIQQLSQSKLIPHIIIFFCKKANYMYDTKTHTQKKIFLDGICGRNSLGEFIGYSKLFIIVGLFDNFIKLFRFSKKKKFELLREVTGNSVSIEKIMIFPRQENRLLLCSKQSLIEFRNQNKFNRLILDKKKKVFEKKCGIRTVLLQPNFSEKDGVLLILGFFRLPNFFLVHLSSKKEEILVRKKILEIQEIEKGVSIVIIPGRSEFLYGCMVNKIQIIKYNQNLKCVMEINHHKFRKKREHCIVSAVAINETEIFFVSGCTHGTLKLWTRSNLKDHKKLKVEGKVMQIKWETRTDILIVISNTHIIHIVTPENFSMKKVLKGHIAQITHFKNIEYGKFLITSSLDSTIKIWSLHDSKSISSIFSSFPVVSFHVNSSETCLITAHHFTTTLGFWQILNTSEQNFRSVSYTEEKNGSLFLKIATKKKSRYQKKVETSGSKDALFQKLSNNDSTDMFLFLSYLLNLKIEKKCTLFHNYGYKINLGRKFRIKFFNNKLKSSHKIYEMCVEFFLEQFICSYKMSTHLNFLKKCIKLFKNINYVKKKCTNLNQRLFFEISRTINVMEKIN